MDESHGRDSMKAALGVALILVGVLMVFKLFPGVPRIPEPAKSISGTSPMATQQMLQAQEARQMHQQLEMVAVQQTSYFRSMMFSHALILLGALSLYLSGEAKKSS